MDKGDGVKYNLKSPSVKRILQECRELRNPTSQYHAQPLEDNLFEWHFTVKGPRDTAFVGGVYHGRIILPTEYPFKPPSIILLTPNGRFEVGKKICLSISAHHPEFWQPSWSIRTVLLALISFMPTKGNGAIGSLDYTSEERQVLATRSKSWRCETCECLPVEYLPEEGEEEHIMETSAADAEAISQINFKGDSPKSESGAKSSTSSTSDQKSLKDDEGFAGSTLGEDRKGKSIASGEKMIERNPVETAHFTGGKSNEQRS